MTDIHAAPVPPSVIGRYLAALDARDTEECLTTFTPTAEVTDAGHKYHGPMEIGAWLSKAAASEHTFTRTLISTAKTSPGWWLVVNRLDGDVPGGSVTLRYAFELDGGRIARLTITS